MYGLDLSLNTMYDFNDTTKRVFMKPSHLYHLNLDQGWLPK